MADEISNQQELGPNEWLVDEMYEPDLDDPKPVSESGQDLWEDSGKDARAARAPDGAAAPSEAAPRPQPEPAAPATATATAKPVAVKPAVDEGQPLRGAAVRIVENMEASLGIP